MNHRLLIFNQTRLPLNVKRPIGFEQHNIYNIFRSVYDKWLRDELPKKIGVYNGIAVRDRGLFDLTDEQPDYEDPLITAIENEIRTGDSALILGRGVSSVVAARAAGPEGDVTVYEASTEQHDVVIETSN